MSSISNESLNSLRSSLRKCNTKITTITGKTLIESKADNGEYYTNTVSTINTSTSTKVQENEPEYYFIDTSTDAKLHLIPLIIDANNPYKIQGSLYLGSQNAASNEDEIIKNNVKYIVNIGTRVPNFFQKSNENTIEDTKEFTDNSHYVIYHNITVKDLPSENILQFFESACLFILNSLQNGSSVLVHCNGGISRSSSIIIAFMLKFGGYADVHEALAVVKKQRVMAQPNVAFIQQLTEWNQTVIKEKAQNLIIT